MYKYKKQWFYIKKKNCTWVMMVVALYLKTLTEIPILMNQLPSGEKLTRISPLPKEPWTKPVVQ